MSPGPPCTPGRSVRPRRHLRVPSWPRHSSVPTTALACPDRLSPNPRDSDVCPGGRDEGGPVPLGPRRLGPGSAPVTRRATGRVGQAVLPSTDTGSTHPAEGDPRCTEGQPGTGGLGRQPRTSRAWTTHTVVEGGSATPVPGLWTRRIRGLVTPRGTHVDVLRNVRPQRLYDHPPRGRGKASSAGGQ